MIPLSAEYCQADNAISTEATPFGAPPLFFIAAAFATPAKPAPNKELIFNMLRCLQTKRRNKTEFLCRICLSLLRNKSGKMEDKYIQQFEEIVIRLEKVESQNDLLVAALILVAVLVVAASVAILVRMKRNGKRDRLTKALLTGHAEALPEFTDKVNDLSGRSIKLSLELYEDFQNAIDAIRKQQHNRQAVIVNDEQFAADYPEIAKRKNLSPTEKLVAVLTKEGFDASHIALFLGTSAASVRAIKSRTKSKMSKI